MTVTMVSANNSDRSPDSTGSTRTEFLVGIGVGTLRMADRPDEVHTESIAKNELRKWGKLPSHPTPQVIAESPRCA